jgi:hypothetical protein
VDDLRREMGNGTAPPANIPLDLAPLLSPYEQYHHLSLKVERLPVGARLSAGRNNGDRTWSLAVDELDGLIYLPPAGANDAHRLAIRIFNLDGEYAATLAVVEVTISPSGAAAALAVDAAPTSRAAANPGKDSELARLRDELAAIHAVLSERDTELAQAKSAAEEGRKSATADAQAALQKAEAAWKAGEAVRLAAIEAKGREQSARALAETTSKVARAEAALAAAQSAAEQARQSAATEAQAALQKTEASWKAGEAQRLAAAEAQWREQSARALAEATSRVERAEAALAEARAQPQSARDPGKDAELVRLRDELAAIRAAFTKRDTELAEARSAAEQARKSAATEMQAALQKAEANAKAGEAVRLAAAEANWREQSARALAEATSRIERAEAALAKTHAQSQPARDPSEAVELKRLRDELAVARATLSKSEADLAEARSAAEQARKSVPAEVRAALAKAEANWKSGEAQRLAAAEAKAREQTTRSLAEAIARAERAEAGLAEARARPGAARNPGNDAELTRLRDDLASVRAILNDRETELVEARQRREQISAEQSRHMVDAALASARIAWDAELEERLARVAAEAAAALDKNRAAWQAEQQDRVAKAEAPAQEPITQAQARWRQEAAVALTKAQGAWKAGEAQRLAAAEAKGREQAAQALAEANARAERAEAALAGAPAQSAPARDPGAEAELARLRDELAAMRGVLVERETELAEARSASEQARERAAAEAQVAVQKAEQAWKVEAAQRPPVAQAEPAKEASAKNNTRGTLTEAVKRERRARLMRHLVRGGALAASLAGAAILYPRVEPIVVENWLPVIATVTSDKLDQFVTWMTPTPQVLEPTPAAPRPAEQIVERRTVIAAPVANVRAGPSPAAGVIATLPRDTEVSPVERRGSWVLIRFGGDEEGNHKREGWVSGPFLKDATGR